MDVLVGAVADALNGTLNFRMLTRQVAALIYADATVGKHRTAPKPYRRAFARQQAVTSVLVLTPARWLAAVTPRWVAMEQVPGVLPIWRAYVAALRKRGWSAWCGVLNAADYGVPQTRKRAILIARSDGQPAQPPDATHTRHSEPTLFGTSQRWVSMAEALGWNGAIDRRTNSRGPAGTVAPTVTVPTDRPAPTLTGKGGTGQWVLRNPAVPAPKRFAATGRHGGHTDAPPPPSKADPRIGRPGHKDRAGGESQFAVDAIKVEQWELGVLQGFPPDYPWQGTKTSQGQQVGNAVPPLLAAAVLRPLAARVAAVR